MYRLDNAIRPYAWGSVTAIPELLGVPLTGGPQAEMWLGAHPGAPSAVRPGPGDEPRRLDEVIAADPQRLLGPDTVRRFGPELPFLMKVLAADQPLSLQVHPTIAQAEAGFDAEEAAGVPIDAPVRNYKDRHHKPEMILAIRPLSALSGFRPPQQARAVYRAILGRPATGSVHAAVDRALAQRDEGAALRDALAVLLAGGREVRSFVTMLVGDATSTTDPVAAGAADTIGLLARFYPADPGVAVSVLLNRVELAPGEALFLDAGDVHAYLRGVGIEVMAASDNVLRGGLTPKHVDVAELRRIVVFRARPPHLVTPRRSGDAQAGTADFVPPVGEFRLQAVELRAGASAEVAHHGPTVVLVASGTATVRSGDETLRLERGQSVFVAAREPAPTLTAEGEDVVAYATTTGSVGE